MIAVIGSLVFVPGCKRTDLADPDMHEPAGFFINLSGVANPGLLFVSQGGGWQNSYINMTALYNDGSPVVGKGIIMKINEEFGTFPGDKRTAVITTNSQGKASIRYSVSQLAIDQIGADLLIYIQAWMQVDLVNVYDLIPLQLVTNQPDTLVNTFSSIIIGNPDEDTADDDIDLDDTGITGDVTFNVYLYNSTGTSTINYLVTVSDPSGIISSPTNGATGSTPFTEIITIDSSVLPVAGNTASIIFTVTSPSDLLGTTITITITIY